MADIEHNTIADPNRHEPKGITTATLGQVYAADGGGADSGTWKEPLPSGADVATKGQMFISDGLGSGAWKNGANIYGEMAILTNTTPRSVTGAVDTTLNSDSDYSKVGTVPGTWSAGVLSQVTFDADKLVIQVDGTYVIHVWMDLEISNTNTLVGVKYATNDVAPFSIRKLLTQSNNSNNVANVAGTGIVLPLVAGDTLSLYIAADATTNVIARDAGLVAILLEEA